MRTVTEGIDIKSEVASRLTTISWPHANEFRDLLRVAVKAADMKPLYFRSIFGSLPSWLPPHHRQSEYNIIDPWQAMTTVRYLMDITIPASASTEPDWVRTLFPPVINRRFWRPTRFFRQPDSYGNVCTFPDEHWFFINGVATNADVARINAAYIARLFHRPLTVIQNATDSLGLDLYECAIGKGFKTDPDSTDDKTMTEPAFRATAAILEALCTKKTRRVVVIAHSQGTIIMANVLRAVAKSLQNGPVNANTNTNTNANANANANANKFEAQWHEFTRKLMGGVQTEADKNVCDQLANSLAKLADDGKDQALRRLAKLEIYTFANCADKMLYVYPSIPYMEHFANELDLVARLGVLSPFRDGAKGLIEIDGPVYEQPDAWGHLLNEHYLTAIADYVDSGSYQYRCDENPYPNQNGDPASPRLYGYCHGEQPDAELPQLRLP